MHNNDVKNLYGLIGMACTSMHTGIHGACTMTTWHVYAYIYIYMSRVYKMQAIVVSSTRLWLPDSGYQSLAARSGIPDSGYHVLATRS